MKLSILLALLATGAWAAETPALREGAVRGGDWRVVYGTVEGPEGRALETLVRAMGPLMLRDPHTTTAHVLPLEPAGRPVSAAASVGERRVKKNVIYVGTRADNCELASRVAVADVPKGGYCVRATVEDGSRVVLLAGDTPSAALWATFDFLDVGIPEMCEAMTKKSQRLCYRSAFFDEPGTNAVPYERRTAPETSVRSVFAWGNVVDDYRSFFREMARSRFNRVILWNEFPPVNAQEVVACAHGWGIAVYWGFAWGWSYGDCAFSKTDDLKGLADGIVREWRETWKPLGGDGIYFQSFTEQSRRTINGRSIASMVVEVVNDAAGRIKAEAPGLDLVFGLHADSVREDLADIAKTDPRLEILWENCGDFPYLEWSREDPTPLAKRALALTDRVGFVWKWQTRIDWTHAVHQAGPYLLGCAGDGLLARDRAATAPRHLACDEKWQQDGHRAWEHIRTLRSGGRAPCEFNAVAEYNPPFSFATLCQAELFWNASDPWERIVRRVRLRLSRDF